MIGIYKCTSLKKKNGMFGFFFRSDGRSSYWNHHWCLGSPGYRHHHRLHGHEDVQEQEGQSTRVKPSCGKLNHVNLV